MTRSGHIPQFQDLELRPVGGHVEQLRAELIAEAAAPWRHIPEKEEAVGFHRGVVIAFERAADDVVARVGLALFSDGPILEIVNILPLDVQELDVDQYNAALNDFADRVARPAATRAGYSLTITAPTKTLDDWLPPAAAIALRQFSGAANKSSGTAHPLDRRRWFAFLIAAHAQPNSFDSGHLADWLQLVEGWDEDEARELAARYEYGIDLLRAYDETR